jgi:hypothetical protein
MVQNDFRIVVASPGTLSRLTFLPAEIAFSARIDCVDVQLYPFRLHPTSSTCKRHANGKIVRSVVRVPEDQSSQADATAPVRNSDLREQKLLCPAQAVVVLERKQVGAPTCQKDDGGESGLY